MVLKPEPLFEAVESLLGHGVGARRGKPRVTQKRRSCCYPRGDNCSIRRPPALLALERVIFICGRYEGVTSAWRSIWLRKKSPLATSC